MNNPIHWNVPQLPDKIKVAAFDFTLDPFTNIQAMASNRYGECDRVAQIIRFDPSVTPFKVADTLLHEINHAIYWAYNMDDSDKEERLAGTFATAWAAVYRDNPWLLPWLAAVLNPLPALPIS